MQFNIEQLLRAALSDAGNGKMSLRVRATDTDGEDAITPQKHGLTLDNLLPSLFEDGGNFDKEILIDRQLLLDSLGLEGEGVEHDYNFDELKNTFNQNLHALD